MTDLIGEEEVRTGGDLFYATADRFDHWFADAYGIQQSYDTREYKEMNVEQAREVAQELIEIAGFCERLEVSFPDVHGGG